MSQNSYTFESNSSSSTDSEDGDDTNNLEVEMISSIVQRSHELLQAYQHETEVRRRRRFIQRNREDRHARLVSDYFSDNPVYPDYIFRRRFCMRKELFLLIVNALQTRSSYFQQNIDAIGRQSLSPLQKCTAAIRQLAYGVPADHLDEYLRMAMFKDSSKCMKKSMVLRVCLEALIGNSQEGMGLLRLSLKRLLHTICGYDMLFLVLQDHILKGSYLKKNKKLLERMWKEHSGCFSLDGQL
ncbi:5-formaminoimidazole-4-carboxamide-1-(beta)-D-ribofuranosyl 5'-monophosphate synthetase [Striga asiatica]|uniref:5-formaminoimidazole-4-carboxamide-1-(Beta)-D-ribofuranosyl 5'-monophosphate synthetase n=1 Tax=Striga asiatica TaxID=4170 RepID=A0A5A7PCN4_STRAF|nr:5-formaminoimidazole-4-carboxamide-1-(beta)-D-ribofuranosyl 5'-monophosphate synthetase [Striga asiatica]